MSASLPNSAQAAPIVPLPVRRLPRVRHIGTTIAEGKTVNSYERSGLSVCRPAHVADWSRIARLAGHMFTLTRSDGMPGRFVDLHWLWTEAKGDADDKR